MSQVPNILVSLDVSYRGLGCTIMYKTDQDSFPQILTYELVAEEEDIDSFFGVTNAVAELELKVFDLLRYILGDRYSTESGENRMLLIEMPSSRGLSAPRLYALDVAFVRKAYQEGYRPVYCSNKLVQSVLGGKAKDKRKNPGFCQLEADFVKNDFNLALLNSKKVNKRASIFLCRLMKDDFSRMGFDVLKLKSHNIADSLVFLMAYGYAHLWGQELFPSFGQYLNPKKEYMFKENAKW